MLIDEYVRFHRRALEGSIPKDNIKPPPQFFNHVLMFSLENGDDMKILCDSMKKDSTSYLEVVTFVDDLAKDMNSGRLVALLGLCGTIGVQTNDNDVHFSKPLEWICKACSSNCDFLKWWKKNVAVE